MVGKTIRASHRLLPARTQHRLFREYVRYRDPVRFNRLQQLRTSRNDGGFSLIESERLECIFIHVPKCAGMSITQSLFGDHGASHMDCRHYQIVYSPREFGRFFKFTFVRNPWDRLASAFFFLKAGGLNASDRAFAERHLGPFDDFEVFVTKWVTAKNIHRHVHFQPQMAFLKTVSSEVRLDFIGLFENLDADFDFVCDRLGVNVGLAYVNTTKGRQRDHRALYTDQMIKIVEQVYAEDIAALGYTFDNSSVAGQLAARNQVCSDLR